MKSKTFSPAVPVTRSAIPAAVTVLIRARDTGLNETISLCCLDHHLPAEWKYDESSVVIHHFFPHCSLLPLTSHLTLPLSLLLHFTFCLPPTVPLFCPPHSCSFSLILHFLSPSHFSSIFYLCIHTFLTPSPLLPPHATLSFYHFTFISYPFFRAITLFPILSQLTTSP